MQTLDAVSGTITAKASPRLKVTVTYSVCDGFGSAISVTPAESDFNASEAVEVLNTIVITNGKANCSIKVGPQGPLMTVKYINSGNHLALNSTVKGIPARGDNDRHKACISHVGQCHLLGQ